MDNGCFNPIKGNGDGHKDYLLKAVKPRYCWLPNEIENLPANKKGMSISMVMMILMKTYEHSQSSIMQ